MLDMKNAALQYLAGNDDGEKACAETEPSVLMRQETAPHSAAGGVNGPASDDFPFCWICLPLTV
jgi:hypothetical protein